jgi:hypothetical protein
LSAVLDYPLISTLEISQRDVKKRKREKGKRKEEIGCEKMTY